VIRKHLSGERCRCKPEDEEACDECHVEAYNQGIKALYAPRHPAGAGCGAARLTARSRVSAPSAVAEREDEK
jgi:hypothetical protein